MKYNPEQELTDEQLKGLSEDEFFEYLDTKAAYLKQFTTPLGQYHVKKFASATLGREMSTKELRSAKQLGRLGDDMRAESIKKAANELGGDPKFRDKGIKNIKTHRSQWFD